MMKDKFRIAMLNRLSLAPYYDPTQTDSSGWEWLIVERSGTLLTISDGSAEACGRESAAPDTLVANNTLAAVLIESGPDTDSFLFMRHLPPPSRTEGNFFPADGYARLFTNAQGQLQMQAHGRHALQSEIRHGKSVFIDVALPPAHFPGALSWHFDAEQKPWSQQS
jgi:hypothetical protein